MCSGRPNGLELKTKPVSYGYHKPVSYGYHRPVPYGSHRPVPYGYQRVFLCHLSVRSSAARSNQGVAGKRQGPDEEVSVATHPEPL